MIIFSFNFANSFNSFFTHFFFLEHKKLNKVLQVVSGWAMQPLVDYSYNYNWPTAWQLPNILYWNQKKLCYKKELKVVQFVFFVSLTKQLSPLKGHCHEKSIQFISQGVALAWTKSAYITECFCIFIFKKDFPLHPEIFTV